MEIIFLWFKLEYFLLLNKCELQDKEKLLNWLCDS